MLQRKLPTISFILDYTSSILFIVKTCTHKNNKMLRLFFIESDFCFIHIENILVHSMYIHGYK
jgi:hypothetical protein